MIKSESARAIAEKIYEIEHANWKQKKEWHLNGVEKWHVEIGNVLDASTTATIEQSKDMFSWHVWNKSHVKNGAFLKVVPASDLEIDAIETILNAQPWLYV